MVNSPDMYQYIYDNSEDYHRLVYIPYMFGPTYFGIRVCPYKSVLIPCLHDESYARMKIFRDLYKNLGGIIFHARPEMELANRLYNLGNVKQEILGEGVETDFDYDANRFRKKYGINEPYIIYAGRKDSAKNIDTLIQYFDEFKRRNEKYRDLKLVLIGGGSVNVPETCAGDVVDLGFVDIQDKYDACAGAELLCQPSKNESFSIVIMESWLCERPVLVHEGCAVTTNFAKESNAGLYFNSYFEFEGCVKYILENTEAASKMGKQGRQFVLDNFKWDVITDRICKFLEI
jgi:glycosyltransferase involved in cell wall biosynthesis